MANRKLFSKAEQRRKERGVHRTYIGLPLKSHEALTREAREQGITFQAHVCVILNARAQAYLEKQTV